MKLDEKILKELEGFKFPWFSDIEVRALKIRDIHPESFGVYDSEGNHIIKIFLRGVSDFEIAETKKLAQLVVDLARYAHTASKAYADLASVVSDAIMEVKTNDNDDGRTCNLPTRTIARLKSTLLNSELESENKEGAGAVLQ
ncbi:MAG: hypothetical protein EBR82_43475 [Caulobacteraceae bacterium]|nr:hypothetical protein [Caulobacteraceae bacterium]